MQAKIGDAARKAGYDAVELPDEYGTSILVLNDRLPQAGRLETPEVAREKITPYQGDRVWFHGSANSDVPITEFDPLQRGSSSGAKDAKEGVYFGGRRDTAEAYLDEYVDLPFDGPIRDQYDKLMERPRIIEKQLEADYPGEGFRVARERKKDPRYLEQVALSREGDAFMEKNKRTIKYGSVTEAKLNLIDPYVINVAGEPWDEAMQMRHIKAAKEQGHDGVIFQNMQDSGWFGGSGKDDIALVFDEKNIKTQN